MDEYKDVILSGLEECYEGIWNKVEDLTSEELRWLPSESSNDIQWNIWHIARVEDRWINQRMKNSQELWIKNNWYKHFNLEKIDHGNGDSIIKVREMPNMEISDLKNYFEEVRKITIDYISNITSKELNHIYIAKNRSQSGIWILGHLLVEESQHLGQIAFIRGMMKGINI